MAFLTFKERTFLLDKQKMNFLNLAVLVLTSMVLVLAGMVGYVYWQQNKVLQAVNSLATFVASQYAPPVELADEPEEEEEDDRASVEEEKEVEVVEKVEPKAEVDSDDLEGKTTAQLKELLTKKGIPFGKRDSKNVLLQLLKASS